MSNLQMPLYLQVFEDLKDKIKNRIYKEGRSSLLNGNCRSSMM